MSDGRCEFKVDMYKWLTEEPDYESMQEHWFEAGKRVRRKHDEAVLDRLAELIRRT